MSIEQYRSLIEEKLKESISEMGEKNALRDACEYALTNGGKRLRPILVLMIADALKCGLDVLPAALSVEYFHTASLIADDLPCMDDDDIRREKPSLHKVFEENVAILASYTLIASGYGGIYKNAERMKEDARFGSRADAAAVLCLEAATRCAGMQGATNGQYLDLYPPDKSLETIRKIIFQKTATLFEIAFIFGWLFGGGAIESLKTVQKCAYHLGMAFQIADDVQDAAQSASINIVSVCGKEKALDYFQEEIVSLTESLKELGLWDPSFQKLVGWLEAMIPHPSVFVVS